MKKITYKDSKPFSIRIPDAEGPLREVKFDRILRKYGAKRTQVIRLLIDAYNATDGDIRFPAQLVPIDGN